MTAIGVVLGDVAKYEDGRRSLHLHGRVRIERRTHGRRSRHGTARAPHARDRAHGNAGSRGILSLVYSVVDCAPRWASIVPGTMPLAWICATKASTQPSKIASASSSRIKSSAWSSA